MTLAVRRRAGSGDVLPYAGLVAIVGLAVGGVAWALGNATYDTVVGGFIGIVLAAASLVAGRAIARRETDPRTARLLLIAPLLKLSMAIPRFAVAFVVYDGSADAASYHDEGLRLRASYVEGIFDADLGRSFVGTGFIRAITGVLYTVTGPTLLGAFFVFAFIGFWGLYLFYRAFCLAVPEGDHHRYALLVFLLPSLLFWPSSLGKEAWMTLGLGAIAYGAARVLTQRRHGFAIVVVGLLTAGAVRPHVAAMAAVGLVAAYLTRRRPAGESLTAPLRKLVGLLVLGGALVLAAGQSDEILGIDNYNRDAVQDARAQVVGQTAQGGSEFTNDETDLDPSEFHIAIVSVLFRPFPWEASNAQALIASLEGVVLLGLFAFGWRRLVGAVRSLLRTPYTVLCVAYSVLFIYGFSSFANFGILTRQRVQVLPFVVVLLCLPPYLGGKRELRTLLTEASA